MRLSTNKTIYRAGEEVHVSAQIYDETHRPVSDALVTARIASGSNQSVHQLTDVGQGRYRKTVRLFESGAYRIDADAVVQGHTMGRDTVELSISRFNAEFLDTRANPELMDDLARISGGRSGTPDSLSSILESMDFPPQTIRSTMEIELTHIPLMMIIIVIFLAAEWLIRKRKGML